MERKKNGYGNYTIFVEEEVWSFYINDHRFYVFSVAFNLKKLGKIGISVYAGIHIEKLKEEDQAPIPEWSWNKSGYEGYQIQKKKGEVMKK